MSSSKDFGHRKKYYDEGIAPSAGNVSFGKRSQRFSPKDRKKKKHHSNKFQSPDKKREEAARFRYGNYHQYYGFRNAGQEDPRMSCLKQEWFTDKDVLDIGCNAGHLTLSVACYFSPRSVLGVDIDPELIRMAEKNVRHYITEDHLEESEFPLSNVLNYGPLAIALDPRQKYSVGSFPFNVQFVEANYIISFDDPLYDQESFFDTVLCLSVTKWVHLNWGDAGIRKLFTRIHKHLRAGGNLLLEAQPFQSYARKKKITEEIFSHYKSIKLFPEMFNEYLLKEVGFESCILVDTPAHSSQGFSRPIYLFKKKEAELSHCGTIPSTRHIFYDDELQESQSVDSDTAQLSD